MFDYLMSTNKHWYTLAATGINFKSKRFTSRQVAEQQMYDFINARGLRVEEIYDDHHFKTYICQDNIRFYINRV